MQFAVNISTVSAVFSQHAPIRGAAPDVRALKVTAVTDTPAEVSIIFNTVVIEISLTDTRKDTCV